MKDKVYSIAISSDNRFIVSASEDSSIKIFDLKSKKQRHHWEKIHGGEIIEAIALSNDNRFIVSGSHDRSVKVFDVATLTQTHDFKFLFGGNTILVPIVIYRLST